MNKKLLLILVMTAALHSSALAQTYKMSTGSVSTCGGNFYDNGGISGNYSNSLFQTFTVCASQPLNQIQVSFSSFNIESGNDFLYVYNGSNPLAPLLGIFTGTINPGIFTSSNGCLTFVFLSNGSVTAPGWAASFTCISSVPPPCSTTGCPPGGTSPVNDACINATNLGALPSPANCPNGTGSVIGVTGTTSCANPENPYIQQQGCLTGNNMPVPASDVWYTFTITGSVLNVEIQGMIAPSAALWQGTGCGNLIGKRCAVGSAGVLNTNFKSLAPGQYYLQISGGGPSDQCNFTLLLKNNRDCNACTASSNLTASPPPINGSYSPGQTVTFCYTVTSFNQTSSNWLHGVVAQIGSGWDLTTLTNLSPANSCSGSGNWSWYNTPITSSATGLVAGPGFFYETYQGNNATGLADNNPGNNYGDSNINNNCTWTFCWTITTKTNINCTQGGDLSMNVVSYGDGQTGSWSSVACTTDPPTTNTAVLQCCASPTITFTNPVCGGSSSGSATGIGQGSGPWTYTWYFGTIPVQTNFNQTGPKTVNGLIPGNYTFTTTDSLGCSASSYFTITSPTTLSLTINKTNASCGVNNGSATANITGGIGPFTYLWSTSATTASVNNLGPGVVTVTAIDVNGCAVNASTTITQPTAPVLNISSTNVNCFGGNNGTASVTPVGGVAPYQYLWSNNLTTATINNLTANIYTVTVTDANGCIVSSSTFVTQPVSAVNASISLITPTGCNNQNGSATVDVNGGTAPFYYQWSNGNNTQTATGLPAGMVSVTVTDITGCSSTATGTILQATAAVLNTTVINQPSCFGMENGSASVTVSGGSPPYVYNWSSGDSNSIASNLNSGTYYVTVTDANGCSSSASININAPSAIVLSLGNVDQISCNGISDGAASVVATGGTGNISYDWTNNSSTTNSATSLSPGNYIVIATDANGCTSSTQFTISEPDPINLNLAKTDITCYGNNDGGVTAIASGGTGNLVYTWSGLSSGASQLINLTPGLYSLNVSDQNGCFKTDSIIINEPQQIALSTSNNVTICYGQSTTISVSGTGGSGGFTYLWTNGETDSIIVVSPQTPFPFSVFATDINGCQSDTHTVYINHYSTLNVQAPVLKKICPGQNQDLIPVVSGGDGIYSFLWNEGQTTATINVAPLSDKNYSVIITDGCGTSVMTDILVEVDELPIVSYTQDKIEGCEGIIVNFLNTTQVLIGSSFYWEFGDNTTSTQENPSKRFDKSGNFDVTLYVITAVGCEVSLSKIKAVEVFDNPVSLFTYSPNSEVSILDSRVSFLDLSKDAIAWNWNFGDGRGKSHDQHPDYQFPEYGTYLVELIVQSIDGCIDTSFQKIRIEEDFSIYFPNSFTPDGDGLNDYFFAYGEGFGNFDLKVFDRWGKTVFKSESSKIPWNGRFFNNGDDCPIGIYVFSLFIIDNSGKPHSYTETINLIR